MNMMNAAYDLDVHQHCRNARIIYDLFHVVAKYRCEVIFGYRDTDYFFLKTKAAFPGNA